jgi:hypothetical protein
MIWLQIYGNQKTLDLVHWNGGNPRSIGSDNTLEDEPQISQGLIKKRKKSS